MKKLRPYLRTSELAKAVGVHPNTIRLYEAWGLLATAPRTPSGYRMFTQAHVDQARLVRLVLRCSWLGGIIRRTAMDMVHQAVAGDLPSALEDGHRFLERVQAERRQAEAAAAYLERWAQGQLAEAATPPLLIGEVAKLLDSTVDSLRNWERNGLIKTPRDPHNGYRLYSAAQIGRLRVIRMLIHSGYSTMSVLRMMLQFDRGHTQDLRQVLDTPRPDEDVLYASDRWLSALAEVETHATACVALVEEMIQKYPNYPLVT